MEKATSMADGVRYLTLAQTAAMMGLSTRTIRSWVADSTIGMPAYRVRGRLLFQVSEIREFMTRHRVAYVDVRAQVDVIVAQLQESRP